MNWLFTIFWYKISIIGWNLHENWRETIDDVFQNVRLFDFFHAKMLTDQSVMHPNLYK